MKFLKSSVCIIALISVSGCGTLSERLGSSARVNPNTIAGYGVKQFIKNDKKQNRNKPDNQIGTCKPIKGDSFSYTRVTNLDCFTFPDNRGETAYKAATANKLHRNRLESYLLKRADDICTIEKGKIYATEATTNSSLGALTTGLSVAGTIVTGGLAQNILAGTAAFTSGTRDHINAHVWKNQLTTAITSAIDAERSSVLNEIKKLRNLDHNKYNVDEMIRMANRYHQACSFNTALQVLMESAANKERYDNLTRKIEARDNVYEAIRIKGVLENAETPNQEAVQKVDQKIETSLETWLSPSVDAQNTSVDSSDTDN